MTNNCHFTMFDLCDNIIILILGFTTPNNIISMIRINRRYKRIITNDCKITKYVDNPSDILIRLRCIIYQDLSRFTTITRPKPNSTNQTH